MFFRKLATILTLAGVVPISIAGQLTDTQKLGRALYNDVELSLNRNQSCASCHSLDKVQALVEVAPGEFELRKQPSRSFAHPDNLLSHSAVAEGSVSGRFGSLNPPTAGYAAFTPPFHWDGAQRLWIGGQFWNGRSKTLSDQAGQPFLNANEMAMPSKWAVVTRLRESRVYRKAFRKLFDIELMDILPYEQAPESETPPPGVFAAYKAMTVALASFEESRVFNRFDSKYDFVLAGMTQFTEQEARGFALFMGEKAQCSICHSGAATTAPDSTVFPALFSNYAYDNLGVPENANIPGNPAPDAGLGGRPEIAAKDPDGSEVGKQKVVSLRNVALTAPYMHNGVFRTLEQVVHFYNTRDTKPNLCSDNNDPGFAIDCWPEAEFPDTMNAKEVGNLSLSPEEEADIVAFLHTLTDNYPLWGNRNGLSDPSVPKGTPSPINTSAFPFLD
ncbi:MAG: hypothetical protein MI864_10720 [Pseudomonadales bacterium]|nr:hypothetical protein [Pseudomonadales bacterium]